MPDNTTPAGAARRRAGPAGSSGAMDHPVALISGASRGIGKVIARQLAAVGLTVHVGSGDAARGQRAAADIAADIAGDARLLVLETTADQENLATFRIYETNVCGVVAVTNAFLPALRRSAHPRIVNISSGTGSLAWATGPQFAHRGSYAAYRSSKAALNALTVFYADALAGDGVKVNALAPGLRRTGLNATAAASDGDPAQAAAGAVRLALLPDEGPSGEFFSWDGTPVPW